MNLALGTLYGWSVFVAPLEKQFGWKRADTSLVFTIAVVMLALGFVVAGRIQDRIGPLFCSLTGSILASLGFFLCAYTTNLTYLWVCFGLIGLGNGFGYATPIPVMAKWFPDKRGLAVGLAVGGYGAGSAIFGPLSQLKLIPAYGLADHVQDFGRDLFGDDAGWSASVEESAGRLQAGWLDTDGWQFQPDLRGISLRLKCWRRRHSISCGWPMRSAARPGLMVISQSGAVRDQHWVSPQRPWPP